MNQLEKLVQGGYRRIGTPARGFRWVTANGKRVLGAERARLDALGLPPAWTDVHASEAPGAKLQAVGRDKAGRWQYRYHPDFRRQREAAKYRRLVRFAEALPRMRLAIDRDLGLPGLPREKVLACAVQIIMTCFMRAGSEVYMRENGSFGVATLRPRHVSVEKDLVRFDFPGKSGKRHVRELRDARVARICRALAKVPGRDLLKFEADDGYVDVRRRHVNAYIREVMGGPFTAKDFRTWAGTLIAACELARAKPEIVPGRTSTKRVVSAAVKATAHVLGNTPAVCRSSYINPGVLSSFERGKVVEDYVSSVEELVRHHRGLHAAEKALLALLQGEKTPAANGRIAPARAAAPRRSRTRPAGDLPLPAAWGP
jgi:DNA topoisomerase-1